MLKREEEAEGKSRRTGRQTDRSKEDVSAYIRQNREIKRK